VPDRDQVVQQLVQLTRVIAEADLESPDVEHFNLAKKQMLNATGDEEERALIGAISWPAVESLV